MSQQRHKAAVRHHTASSPVLFPTASFYASWRGQLLICSVVLIIGGVCFVLREPIAKFKRRRQEVLSSARMEELVSMEKETKEEKEVEEVREVKKVNKEKKKDAKKRKVSLLKVPTSAASGESSAVASSTENSPAVTPKSPSPSAKSRSSPAKGKAPALPVINDDAPSAATPSRPKSQLELSPLPRPSEAVSSQSPPSSPPSPCDVPLPDSPVAGPSRLGGNSVADVDPIDNDTGNTSESAQSNSGNTDPSSEVVKSPSAGFSVIPEEGYLPPSSAPLSSKKKKRKGKAAPPPIPVVDRRMSQSGERPPSTPGRIPESPVPLTPSRRARQASLTRPINADLEGLLTEREKMIETLRAEIGLSKVEEARVKEEISQSRATEERLKGDIERIQSARRAAEHAARKRESELNARLSHLSSHYTNALHRITALEAFMRDSSRPIPPPSPALPGQGPMPSPIPMPMHHLQPLASPIPPSSPFNIGFAPSPRAVSAGFVPYPSPGMFSSPMLHPNMGPHSHSPLPFRRASAGIAPEDGLAGPLTPGHAGSLGSSQYPFDLGIMPPPSPGNRPPIPNGPLTAADLRRQSIESSVLKKKVKDMPKSGSESEEDSNRGSEPLGDIEESTSVEGLGMGNVEQPMMGNSMQRDGTNGGSVTNSSHPSSPSPPNRASMLLTPASADLFQRALVHGTDTPEEIARRESLTRDLAAMKVMPDPANGHFHYAGSSRSINGSEESGSDDASAYDPQDVTIHAKAFGSDTDGHADAGASGIEDDFVPMFASLAHTPQQVAEIQRMKDEAIKSRETSRVKGEQAGGRGTPLAAK